MSRHLSAQVLVASALAAFTFAVASGGCSSSTVGTGGGDGGSSGSGNVSGGNGGSGGSEDAQDGDSATAMPGVCPGDLAACPLGELSPSKWEEACNLMVAAFEDPAGTKYTCGTGRNAESLTVFDLETCVGSPVPPACTATAQDVIDCFEAAKVNACGAMDLPACMVPFEAGGDCTT